MSNIIWKGINSNTINGLIISELPPISKSKQRTEIIEIDGLDGDIVNDLGYSSYDKEIKIGLFRNYDIDEIINYFNGSGNLVLSNESDKYYKASIISQIDYNKLLRFKTAKVKFHCQPYKYKLNETTVNGTNSVSVTNYGNEKSKPIITLKGTANQTVSFYLNGTQIFQYTFDSDGEVVIDSEKQDAYLGTVLKNRNMTGEFPILNVGNNTITCTNAQITVLANSRWL